MKRVYAKKTKESKAAKVRVEGDCALAEAIGATCCKVETNHP